MGHICTASITEHTLSHKRQTCCNGRKIDTTARMACIWTKTRVAGHSTPSVSSSLHESRVSITWMTSPEPSSPASVSGVSVVVALWLIALATAFKTLVLWNGATLKTWGLDAKYDTNPMKHAICNSSDSTPSEPPAPLPPASRWSRPVRIRHSHHFDHTSPNLQGAHACCCLHNTRDLRKSATVQISVNDSITWIATRECASPASFFYHCSVQLVLL